MEVRIRRATVEDASEIARIEKSLDVQKDRDTGARGFTRATFSKEDYAKAAKIAEYFFVAETGQRIAGFVIASSLAIAKTIEGEAVGICKAEKRAPKALFVVQTAIGRRFQRKGIASKLYGQLIQKSNDKLAPPTIFLTIVLKPIENKASVAFHEKLGFKKVCEFKEKYKGKNFDIGLFEKTI